MLGFSGKQFGKEVENFLSKKGIAIADTLQKKGKETVERLKETIFPELKGWEKTAVVDNKYSFVIIMAGIKKENATVNIKDGVLYVTGTNSTGALLVDFQQTVGKDDVLSAKLEDGVMKVMLQCAPETKHVNID